MKISPIAKRLVKAPFRAFGLDVTRYTPPPSFDHASLFAPRFQPEEHWLAKAGIRTILDIGAHEGEFASRISKIIPHATLICFEPLDAPFKILSSRFAGHPAFRAIQCALGATPGRFEMRHNEYAPSSSLRALTDLHKEAFSFPRRDVGETIEVRRLSDVAKELPLENPLLLKLDVQGFEDQVIAGGEDIVAKAAIMIVEVSFQSLYQGGPLFEDIYRMLTQRGFSYRGNFEQLLSPQDGRVLQADAFFCRT